MKILCYDMGGTDLKYGVIENNNLLFSSKTPTKCYSTPEELKEQYIYLTKEILQKFPDIQGVAISTAGSVDYIRGVIVAAPEAIPVFQDFDFKTLFKENFNLDCFVDNDVNSFAAAELNEDNPYHNFIVMTVGTGIGGAIIVNDTLWRGANFNAGEIGRMLINGISYEKQASVSALLRNAKSKGLDIKNGLELFNLYDNKDELALKVVNDFYQKLATGLANIIYMFNPEAIFIGGGISQRKTFIEELEEHLNPQLEWEFRNITKIKIASHQNDGGMYGAYRNYLKYITKESK